MDQVEQLLRTTIDGIGDGSNRFHIIDHLHLHDTETNLKYHMYDSPEPFHITKFTDGTAVASMGDFIQNQEHMKLFTELKTKLDNVYQTTAQKNRDNLVQLFNNPDLSTPTT